MSSRQISGERRSKRPARRLIDGPAVAMVIAMIACLFVAVPVASAAEVISQRDTTIPADRTFREDAYLFGSTVTFDGQSTRDVTIGAGDIMIGRSARIAGNVNAAGQDVRLQGTTERSARVAGRTVTVSGSISGDLLVAAQDVTIEPGAQIRGDLLVAAQNVTIRGSIDGDIRGEAAHVDLASATVGGNTDVRTDDLDLSGTTHVDGNLTVAGNSDPVIESTAAVNGTVERTERNTVNAGGVAIPSGYIWGLTRLVVMLFTGLVIVLLIPKGIAAASDGVRRRFPVTLGLGIVVLILIPIGSALLLVTIIGIPLSLILLASYLIVLYVSQVIVGLAIGRRLLPTSWLSYGRGYNILAMVIGVTIIGLLRLIPWFHVGGVIALVVGILGLGAIFTATRNDGRRLRLPRSQAGTQGAGPAWNPPPYQP